jgi:hypothetical protein
MVHMPEFANLSREPVREYWINEAREFTAWLAEQIDAEDPSEIDDIIQLDLALRGTERWDDTPSNSSPRPKTDGLA